MSQPQGELKSIICFLTHSGFLFTATKKNNDLVPCQFQRNTNGGDSTQDDLQQHAAAAWIKVGMSATGKTNAND